MFDKTRVEPKIEDKIVDAGKLVWNVVTPQMRFDQTFYVQLTELNLQDDWFSLGFG